LVNVNVDIHANEAQQRAERTRQVRNAAKLTAFTFVQNTNGVGYRQMGFLFDVTFSTEPVFSYGAQLVSIATAGHLPAGSAIVTHWVQDKGGRFNGVVLVAQVTIASAGEFKYSSKTPVGPVADARVVVAHNLTFTGPALPRSKSETTLAMDTLKSLSTGIV
jgi:hypothetical protein